MAVVQKKGHPWMVGGGGIGCSPSRLMAKQQQTLFRTIVALTIIILPWILFYRVSEKDEALAESELNQSSSTSATIKTATDFSQFRPQSMMRDDDSSSFQPQPGCNATGFCHESPWIPSPRTEYSSWSYERYHHWWTEAAFLNHSAQEFYSAIASKDQAEASKNSKRPIIFLGDSIFEGYKSSDPVFVQDIWGGQMSPRNEGVGETLSNLLPDSSYLKPLILAISGDQTQHLLYRLLFGGGLPFDAKHKLSKDAVFVMLIGTNNLGNGEKPAKVARGILTIAELLLQQTPTGTSILIYPVLPRSDQYFLNRICPPACSKSNNGAPLTSFRPAIEKVNTVVQQTLQKYPDRYPPERVIFPKDCANHFWHSDESSKHKVRKEWMMDELHPNKDGHAMLIRECLLPFLPE